MAVPMDIDGYLELEFDFDDSSILAREKAGRPTRVLFSENHPLWPHGLAYIMLLSSLQTDSDKQKMFKRSKMAGRPPSNPQEWKALGLFPLKERQAVFLREWKADHNINPFDDLLVAFLLSPGEVKTAKEFSELEKTVKNDVVGPLTECSQQQPNAGDQTGGILFERTPPGSKAPSLLGAGRRCYNIGLLPERGNPVAPSANARLSQTDNDVLERRKRLLFAATSVCSELLPKFAHQSYIDILDDRVESLNPPLIGDVSNKLWTGCQVNISPLVHNTTEATTNADSLGASGDVHNDRNDSTIGLSAMLNISSIDGFEDSVDLKYFHLLSLGVYVSVQQYTLLYFSGLLTHSGMKAGWTSPKPVPSHVHRIQLILYPNRLIVDRQRIIRFGWLYNSQIFGRPAYSDLLSQLIYHQARSSMLQDGLNTMSPLMFLKWTVHEFSNMMQDLLRQCDHPLGSIKVDLPKFFQSFFFQKSGSEDPIYLSELPTTTSTKSQNEIDITRLTRLHLYRNRAERLLPSEQSSSKKRSPPGEKGLLQLFGFSPNQKSVNGPPVNEDDEGRPQKRKRGVEISVPQVSRFSDEGPALPIPPESESELEFGSNSDSNLLDQIPSSQVKDVERIQTADIRASDQSAPASRPPIPKSKSSKKSKKKDQEDEEKVQDMEKLWMTDTKFQEEGKTSSVFLNRITLKMLFNQYETFKPFLEIGNNPPKCGSLDTGHFIRFIHDTKWAIDTNPFDETTINLIQTTWGKLHHLISSRATLQWTYQALDHNIIQLYRLLTRWLLDDFASECKKSFYKSALDNSWWIDHLVKKVQSFLQRSPRPTSLILLKQDILPSFEQSDQSLLNQALKQLQCHTTHSGPSEGIVEEVDLAGLQLPKYLKFDFLVGEHLEQATILFCSIVMARWLGFPSGLAKPRHSVGGNKRWPTSGLPPLLVAFQAINIIVDHLGEGFLHLPIAMEILLDPETILNKNRGQSSTDSSSVLAAFRSATAEWCNLPNFQLKKMILLHLERLCLQPIHSLIPPSPEKLHDQLRKSTELLSEFIRALIPLIPSKFSSLNSASLRLHDRLLPFREMAPSRRCYTASPTQKFATQERVFSLAVFRGILFGSPYIHEGKGPIHFRSVDEFLRAKETLKVAKNLTDKEIEAHFCSPNIYGACIGQMKTDNVHRFWSAASGAETWFSRYHPTLRPFSEAVQWIGSQTFYGMGPLLHLLLAGDLAYDGLVAPPSPEEMGELVWRVKRGAYKKLEQEGLVTDGSTKDEFTTIFVQLYNSVTSGLTDIEKEQVGWDVIVFEHTLCKWKRLTPRSLMELKTVKSNS